MEYDDFETVGVEGQVKEIFGDKFIVETASGRTLIETGPGGQALAEVEVGDKIFVEGEQHNGFVHAWTLAKNGGEPIEFLDDEEEDDEEDEYYNVDAYILGSVVKAGYKDPKILDVKKHHAEVSALDSKGKSWSLHVDFEGEIYKREAMGLIFDESEVRALIEKAGYAYGGSMRPEKKHVVVTATNSSGKKVEIDVHRDGSIKKERPVS